MDNNDPKLKRPIPDEGLFTIHFATTHRPAVLFDVQVPDLSPSRLSKVIRQEFDLSTAAASYQLPKGRHIGTVKSRGETVGRFTITPPTLKGDPDEPT